MKAHALALLLALSASPAFADRGLVTALGVTGDMRAFGRTYSSTANADAHPLAGLRLTFGLEPDALPVPPSAYITKDARLVPELLAGFLMDDVHAEGYVGAGLRAEVQIANGERDDRMALYTALRGIVIGGDHDGATEAVIGGYVLFPGNTRFGWEGGAMARPRPHRSAAEFRELDAELTFYIGWSR